MAKNNAECGKREERAIVKDLESKGYSARRQPGSGNRAVDLQHDIVWRDSPIGKLHIEAKFRDKSQWRTLEGWQAGADILTVRAARGERMVFMSWDLLMQLVGSAVDRSELAADLPPVEPDKPWIDEAKLSADMYDPTAMVLRLAEEEDRRDKIQAAHKNPKSKPMKPRREWGR